MNLETYRTHFKEELSTIYPPEEVDAISSIALQYVLEINRVEIALSRKQILSTSQVSGLDAVLKRLLQAEPIQYITGATEFYGLVLQLNKTTLIPRPETEELVEWILAEAHSLVESPIILDIGTGSGAIAIAIAKNLPKARIEALDISASAIATAASNAKKNEVAVTFFKQDILAATHLEKQYDLMVSNPPYVRELEKAQMKTNVLSYEPHTALFVKNSTPLIFYQKIAQLAFAHLRPGGQLFFEINEYLGAETCKLIKEMGFDTAELRKDIFGKDRMIRAIKNE